MAREAGAGGPGPPPEPTAIAEERARVTGFPGPVFVPVDEAVEPRWVGGGGSDRRGTVGVVVSACGGRLQVGSWLPDVAGDRRVDIANLISGRLFRHPVEEIQLPFTFTVSPASRVVVVDDVPIDFDGAATDEWWRARAEVGGVSILLAGASDVLVTRLVGVAPADLPDERFVPRVR